MPLTDTVLVTGGSGFIGSHCIVQLLEKGYHVKTTVRSLTRSDEVRKMLKVGGIDQARVDTVEFCAAELTKDDGWSDACAGCTYVLHVASPFPSTAPKHEDDLIVPARDGALRVLQAAKAAGSVKRVVLTSSGSAVMYGHPDRKPEPFTEEDWTNMDNSTYPVTAYAKSKTIAERAAWDWGAKEGNGMELSVVCPVSVNGPVLSGNFATSIVVISRMMNGETPGLPRLSWNTVDVRDVADLHIRAMTSPRAAGQRYIANSGDPVTMLDIASVLKRRLGDRARKVPTRVLPDMLFRVVAWFDPSVALIAPELGKSKLTTSEKAQTELGWKARSSEEAIVAAAESLESFGLIKK